jgi:SAM-dependent methyltransferase
MRTAQLAGSARLENGNDGACPVCRSLRTRRIRSAADLAPDLADALASGRRLMHSEPAPVSGCEGCGSIFRHPDTVAADLAQAYADDEYGASELGRLYRRESGAYGPDDGWLATHGLEPGARVLEIGSYVGAMQSYLRRNGCEAVGVDVGREVSAFARARGACVLTGTFDPEDFPPRWFDAVLVLNCFEQLPDPVASLDGARKVLRRGGTLVVRTPNADFARRAHRPGLRSFANAHGILGVPFARCLSPSALHAVVRGHGFEVPRMMIGPWIELVARRA